MVGEGGGVDVMVVGFGVGIVFDGGVRDVRGGFVLGGIGVDCV